MGPSALGKEHSFFLAAPTEPNSGHVQRAITSDAAPVSTNQDPAAVICHTSPYIMHNNPAGSMPGHYGLQHPAGGGSGVVTEKYRLLRRSSSCASSMRSLPAHVQQELLLQQGPKVRVAPGTHYADAAATAAPTSPGTPGGSPRDSPSTAALSTASAAAMRYSSSPRFEQQQAPAAARPQRSNLMALADAAVACQQQQSGESAALAQVDRDRFMGLGNRVLQPGRGLDLRGREATLAPAVPRGAAAGAHVSIRPAALQCDGFSDVYTSCDLPSAAVASTAAAAAYPAAVPQEAQTRSSLGTAAAAAADLPPSVTKAGLQERLSQELEQSPLLTLLLSRLVRRLRQQQQQQHGPAVGGANQNCGSIQQQQQQQKDLCQGSCAYAAIMPGVLQKQHGKTVSSSSGSSNSCEYRAVKLTKRSYVELPAGCLLVGPGGTAAPTAAAPTAAGANLPLQQQQQQQCMPGSSTDLADHCTATGASPKSIQQQQQCCVQQQGGATQASPATVTAAAAAVQQRQQQQSNAALTSAHAGGCSILNMQQQQAVLSALRLCSAVTTRQHPELQQQTQPTDRNTARNLNPTEAKCASSTAQMSAPGGAGGASATNSAAAAPVPAARINSSCQSCVGVVHKRPREVVAAVPAVMAATAGTVPSPTAVLTAAAAARPRHGNQHQQHLWEPTEAHTNTSRVYPFLEPNTQLPYKRRRTISAAGCAATAADSQCCATGQQRQQAATGSAGTEQQQHRLSGLMWYSTPSPLTSSYPK